MYCTYNIVSFLWKVIYKIFPRSLSHHPLVMSWCVLLPCSDESSSETGAVSFSVLPGPQVPPPPWPAGDLEITWHHVTVTWQSPDLWFEPCTLEVFSEPLWGRILLAGCGTVTMCHPTSELCAPKIIIISHYDVIWGCGHTLTIGMCDHTLTIGMTMMSPSGCGHALLIIWRNMMSYHRPVGVATHTHTHTHTRSDLSPNKVWRGRVHGAQSVAGPDL